MQFTYQNTTRIHFGAGQIAQVANEIPADKKVLVTYGGGSIKQNGVYQQVAEALSGHQWIEFGGIEPNPQFDTLMKAVALIRAEQVDYILAVGGGSVVDGSKFIAEAALFDGDPWDICTQGALAAQTLPLACVLTLPATGSETNTGAVVSRGADKLFFMDERVRPQFAVLDPATTLSLSPRQIANGVVDAFVHVVEQYITYPVGAKVQDRFAEGLLLTLIEEGPNALANPQDLTVRANLMWAASQALNGLIGTGVPQDWATHMIGHELTGHFGVDHARSLSIVLPAMLKLRREQKREKLLQYAERVWQISTGDEDARIDAAIEATIGFFKQMQVPTSLADIDLDAAAIEPVMATLQAHGRENMSERGDVGYAECRAVLEAAL